MHEDGTSSDRCGGNLPPATAEVEPVRYAIVPPRRSRRWARAGRGRSSRSLPSRGSEGLRCVVLDSRAGAPSRRPRGRPRCRGLRWKSSGWRILVPVTAGGGAEECDPRAGRRSGVDATSRLSPPPYGTRTHAWESVVCRRAFTRHRSRVAGERERIVELERVGSKRVCHDGVLPGRCGHSCPTLRGRHLGNRFSVRGGSIGSSLDPLRWNRKKK